MAFSSYWLTSSSVIWKLILLRKAFRNYYGIFLIFRCGNVVKTTKLKKKQHRLTFGRTRDGNGSGRAQIVPIHNPTSQKKTRLLPARLPAGYPLKKYLRIFLKPAGTHGYSIPAYIKKKFIKFFNIKL